WIAPRGVALPLPIHFRLFPVSSAANILPCDFTFTTTLKEPNCDRSSGHKKLVTIVHRWPLTKRRTPSATTPGNGFAEPLASLACLERLAEIPAYWSPRHWLDTFP